MSPADGNQPADDTPATVRLRFKVTTSGPSWWYAAGAVKDVPADRAADLLATKQAEEVSADEPEAGEGGDVIRRRKR